CNFSLAMGQTLTVTVTPGARPEVRHFATDRSITGMAIERFADAESAAGGTKPANVLARRLFELGASGVTVYSNTVTVEAGAARERGHRRRRQWCRRHEVRVRAGRVGDGRR